MTFPFTLFWIREDGQGDINMGEYHTQEEAEAAIPEATAMLIGQCPGPHTDENEDFTRCRDEIVAGRWSVVENEADLD